MFLLIFILIFVLIIHYRVPLKAFLVKMSLLNLNLRINVLCITKILYCNSNYCIQQMTLAYCKCKNLECVGFEVRQTELMHMHSALRLQRSSLGGGGGPLE